MRSLFEKSSAKTFLYYSIPIQRLNAAFEEQRSIAPLIGRTHIRRLVDQVRSRSKQGKAYRKKQSAGVVTYVKLLLRNNEALRRLLGERILPCANYIPLTHRKRHPRPEDHRRMRSTLYLFAIRQIDLVNNKRLTVF